jgi:hypothetical protein
MCQRDALQCDNKQASIAVIFAICCVIVQLCTSKTFIISLLYSILTSGIVHCSKNEFAQYLSLAICLLLMCIQAQSSVLVVAHAAHKQGQSHTW